MTEQDCSRHVPRAMPEYAIRRVRQAHCKRGPAACGKCREMAVERISLLALWPPGNDIAQRRVIQVTIQGEPAWREFDIVATFASEEEAREYAREKGIIDLEL